MDAATGSEKAQQCGVDANGTSPKLVAIQQFLMTTHSLVLCPYYDNYDQMFLVFQSQLCTYQCQALLPFTHAFANLIQRIHPRGNISLQYPSLDAPSTPRQCGGLYIIIIMVYFIKGVSLCSLLYYHPRPRSRVKSKVNKKNSLKSKVKHDF